MVITERGQDEQQETPARVRNHVAVAAVGIFVGEESGDSLFTFPKDFQVIKARRVCADITVWFTSYFISRNPHQHHPSCVGDLQQALSCFISEFLQTWCIETGFPNQGTCPGPDDFLFRNRQSEPPPSRALPTTKSKHSKSHHTSPLPLSWPAGTNRISCAKLSLEPISILSRLFSPSTK